MNQQQLPVHRICEIIAILYRVRQKYHEAAVFAGHVLHLRRELFGSCHMDTIRSESNLGVILGFQGKNAEAYVLLSGVYEKLKARKGEGHAWTRRALHNFAMACARRGEMYKAQHLLEQLVQTGVDVHDNQIQLAASNLCLEWLRQTESPDMQGDLPPVV
jgi:hypothetical protein